jgi:8-oxo-dGTP diphosphatase
MSKLVEEHFGNKIRIRVCGLCIKNNQLLLVNHKGVVNGDFWAPPGGGIQFGETSEQCLIREFQEESGLQIMPTEFLFSCEFVKPPLHALELFYSVEITGGKLIKGKDPEMTDNQIIEEVKFMDWQKIDMLNTSAKHGIFNLVSNSSKIVSLRGHFKL